LKAIYSSTETRLYVFNSKTKANLPSHFLPNYLNLTGARESMPSMLSNILTSTLLLYQLGLVICPSLKTLMNSIGASSATRRTNLLLLLPVAMSVSALKVTGVSMADLLLLTIAVPIVVQVLMADNSRTVMVRPTAEDLITTIETAHVVTTDVLPHEISHQETTTRESLLTLTPVALFHPLNTTCHLDPRQLSETLTESHTIVDRANIETTINHLQEAESLPCQSVVLHLIEIEAANATPSYQNTPPPSPTIVDPTTAVTVTLETEIIAATTSIDPATQKADEDPESSSSPCHTTIDHLPATTKDAATHETSTTETG
jgi:hypothetical protein